MAEPFKVIIVGAGLGGLACAVACRLQGLEVLVLEKASEILPIGAGIQIPPNGARVLERLGLLPQIREKGTELECLTVRRYKDGRLLALRPLGDSILREHGVPWLVIHRHDYHAVLLNEAKRLNAQIRLNVDVETIDFDETIVHLAGGNVVKGDVIIGADGLWSTTRDCLLGAPSPPLETGDLAYRGTFSEAQLLALHDPRVEALCAQKTVTLWMGPQKHCVFYPVRGGKEFNLVLLRPDNLPANARTVQGDIEEMRSSFEGWDEILRKIISCIPSVLKWKLCHHDELRTWTKNHTALLGDSCHPTLPYQAQGAAMAVEDGAVIGYLLGSLSKSLASDRDQSPNRTDLISRVLKLYERLRKSRTTLNIRGAMANRIFYHMPDGAGQEKRDEVLATADYKTVRTEYNWVDSKYQRDLLAYDAVKEASNAFEQWWSTEKAGKEKRMYSL